MKLHPQNPTPGLEYPINMITFEPFESHLGQSFKCKVPQATIGYIYKRENEYEFFPNNFYGAHYGSGPLKEICNMLDSLNNPPMVFTD